MKIMRALSSSVRFAGYQLLGPVALVGLLAGAGGCTASATVTTSNGSCAADSSVSCSAGDGWSCSGSAEPQDDNADLVCSADQGTGEFCCFTSMCGYDSSVSCSGGAIGYSCPSGDSAPDTTDPTLVCSEPTVASDGNDEYCCYTNTVTIASGTTITCTQDPTVTCPDPSSYGFSCTGSDTPDQDFGSNLNCSTPTVTSTGTSTYCCND